MYDYIDTHSCNFIFFFFNDTATTEIYTLSLHDALPISRHARQCLLEARPRAGRVPGRLAGPDRKSTRLNSSHITISYAVFCLKKKKKNKKDIKQINIAYTPMFKITSITLTL